MKWQICCFEPFNRARSNSSEIVWRNLKSLKWDGQVEFIEPLAVSFRRAWPQLRSQLNGESGVLALGQAESRSRISLERVALNWIDANIKDNDGEQPRLGKVKPGPDLLWSQVPWDQLGESEAWSRSYSAGVFVCNQLMYEIVDWGQTSGKLGGFVHIPLLASQDEEQFLRQPKMQDAQAFAACASILRFLIGL